MEAQVNSVSRAAVYQLHLVCRLRPYLPADCLARVVHALVISRLDYCNALFEGDPETTTNPECGSKTDGWERPPRQRAFLVVALALWNALSSDVKEIKKLPDF